MRYQNDRRSKRQQDREASERFHQKLMKALGRAANHLPLTEEEMQDLRMEEYLEDQRMMVLMNPNMDFQS